MSTTTTSTHTTTIAELYAAFGRGDVPMVLEYLSDDISWDHGLRTNDLPWMQPRTGKQQVEEFFGILAQGMSLSVFDPQVIAGDGDTVVAVIRIAGTILSNDNPVAEDLWVHLWSFDGNGKVATFRHIGDLAREEIPFRG